MHSASAYYFPDPTMQASGCTPSIINPDAARGNCMYTASYVSLQQSPVNDHQY